MDVYVSYDVVKEFVTNHGFNAFIDLMNKKYPSDNFFTVSKDWYEDRKYICKLKGEYGDLIIRWKEEVQ